MRSSTPCLLINLLEPLDDLRILMMILLISSMLDAESILFPIRLLRNIVMEPIFLEVSKIWFTISRNLMSRLSWLLSKGSDKDWTPESSEEAVLVAATDDEATDRRPSQLLSNIISAIALDTSVVKNDDEKDDDDGSDRNTSSATL